MFMVHYEQCCAKYCIIRMANISDSVKTPLLDGSYPMCVIVL